MTVLLASPCCFKEPNDTSWHVEEEEEGEHDYGHHPDHDNDHANDEDHPEANGSDLDILLESC